MSQHVVRDLIVEIARYTNYDGPSLSIGPSDNSLARMNARNGSHALHLDPQNFEFSRFSGFRLDTHTLLLRVGGPIFGKATKVAKIPKSHFFAGLELMEAVRPIPGVHTR